jgi:WD40 repeat protein
MKNPSRASLRLAVALICLTCALTLAAVAQTNSQPPVTRTIVHSKFGGQIFGWDIDQNGSEGILAEAQTLSNGNVEAAVETFDQTTGKILAVLAKTETQDDFVTLGVAGTSVGLVEHEHSISLLHVQRTFGQINPLSGNKVTGKWTPPIGTEHLVEEVSRNQGATNNAVFAQDISSNFIPYVFSSNVAANTFGPVIQVTDSANFGSVVPPMAYNTATNQAILGGGNGCFGCSPVLGFADLTTGDFTELTGNGFGFINGIAVDSADNILVTTTEDDATVEFYFLNNNSALSVVLPNTGSDPQFYTGADVEFDAVNKLFFVAQPNSSVSSQGSTIYIFDINSNLKGTLNGFSFSNAFNVVPMHIALNPTTKTGFVDGPSANVNEIESFAY